MHGLLLRIHSRGLALVLPSSFGAAHRGAARAPNMLVPVGFPSRGREKSWKHEPDHSNEADSTV